MSASTAVILSEGLPGDLRPLCYSRSTWDVPFSGAPLLNSVLAWLQKMGYGDIFVVDDTPGLWLHQLCQQLPRGARRLQRIDARPAARAAGGGLTLPPGAQQALLLKPCALVEPDVAALERLHEQSGAHATFALVRLDPGALQWPYIPACRMDTTGRVLEVEKLKRTDALGSTRLDNVLSATAPSRPREYWAPRNVALLQAALVAELPLQELAAPLAGLCRALAEQGKPVYGRSMPGRWWSMSTPSQIYKANTDALSPAPPDASDATIRQMVSRLKSNRPSPGHAPRPRGVVAQAAAAVERQARWPGVDVSAAIDEDASIGNGVRVGKESRVLGQTCIGPGCAVGERVTVVRSVLGSQSEVDDRSTIENSLLSAGTILPPEIVLKNACMGSGEVRNMLRGVPAGGAFLDTAHAVDEAAVGMYWMESAPVPDRTPGRAGLRLMAQSLENDVYQIADDSFHYVLKRRLDRDARPLLREYHVLRLLAPGVVAPRPFALDLRPEVHVAPCLIMGQVTGKRVPQGNMAPDLARRIGAACQAIHSVPTELLLRDLPELGGWGYPTLLGYVLEVLNQYRSFLEFRNHEGLEDDDLTRYILQLLEWATGMAEMENRHWEGEVPNTLCHGDLREFNMLAQESDGRIILLDWERCGIGDPAYDMGWFLALSALSKEAEAALEEGYGDGPPGDQAFWNRARTYRIIDLIAWPVHLMQMVQRCRSHAARMTMKAPRLAKQYEDDAYEALAAALNTFGSLSAPGGQGDGYTPASIREMGTLFAATPA